MKLAIDRTDTIAPFPGVLVVVAQGARVRH